jgi:hypothetical protein
MTRSNVLDDCLSLLYDYSGNFHVSIGLIQKLAQQLKLETFVDKLGFDIHGGKNQGSRLTIAGSTILIDIDFGADDIATTVSLSLANQNENVARPLTITNDFFSTTVVTNDLSRVSIDWEKNPYSFLKQSDDETTPKTHSIAEKILLSNLTKSRLNQFPKNLQYLANIDRLSCTNYDLFVFVEKLALILTVMNILEGINENTESWELASGLTSTIGKVQLNNDNLHKLGLFINYWQDFRYINHEYQQKTQKKDLLIGDDHTILISIEPSTNDHPINYLTREIWKLTTGNYDFQLNSPPSSVPLNGWMLNLNLNHSVWIPSVLLKYFNWLHVVDKQPNEIENQMFGEFYSTNKEIVKQCDSVELKITQDISFDKFIPIESIQIKQLSELTTIIPILRTFILLKNILLTTLQSAAETEQQQRVPGSRRNSKACSGEFTEEARKKLKESLKLPDDVTDEELLGLNVINDSATYSTIGAKRDGALDLETFMNEPEETQSEPLPFIQLAIEKYDFVTNNLILVIEGYLSQEIYLEVTINNGVIAGKGESDQMDVDSDPSAKVIQGLKLTENVYKTLKHIYNTNKRS